VLVQDMKSLAGVDFLSLAALRASLLAPLS
jgi:hypothetical protein